MIRYHGFTCPKCGRHEFGTLHWPRKGQIIGHCHGNRNSGNGCDYTWDRNDPVKEAEAIYNQTPEEWMASFTEQVKEWEKDQNT